MDLGKKITDLEKMENVPEGTSYLAEAGDGSGTKQIEHKKLMEAIIQDIKLGNLEELDTEAKKSVVEAINEVNEKAKTEFTGTDGIKEGTAGMVPAPKPEEEGHVLGANGKWVPPGEGGSLEVLEDMEELEANTDKGKLVDALVVKEMNDSLGGFRFYHDPMIVYTVADSQPYTDENGEYILSSSEKGKVLLADSGTYTSMVIEGDFRSIGGADTVSPFKQYKTITRSGSWTDNDSGTKTLHDTIIIKFPEFEKLLGIASLSTIVSNLTYNVSGIDNDPGYNPQITISGTNVLIKVRGYGNNWTGTITCEVTAVGY